MKKKELLALVNALSTSRRADRIFKELRDYYIEILLSQLHIP